MRNDGILVQKEEASEVGEGGLAKGLWWVYGEGVAEMPWEGMDKRSLEVVGFEDESQNTWEGCWQT